jgi:outer membrane protein
MSRCCYLLTEIWSMLRQLSIVVFLCCYAGGALAQPASLYDVFADALLADPRVKIAQHKVEMGKAQEDSAFGALLPQANFSAQFSDNDVEYDSDLIEDQSFNGERYAVQVRQMLFNWSTLSNRARAEQLVAQRESELLDVMSMLLVDISELYFQVLLADGGVRLLKAEQELVQQQLRETEELYERRLVRVTDYLETQARADKVRTDLIEAENEAALSREELSVLTGSYVGDVLPIHEDFKLPSLENSVDYWVELSMDNNPLLSSKREAVLVAQETIQQEKGGHYPTFDLIFSAQRSDVGYDNQTSPQRDTEYIGVDINLPLFSGGSTSARVREAWSQYYLAREEEEAARREVLKLTRAAWLNTRSSRKRIDSATLSIQSASKSYEAMSKSFSYGTVKAADVLAALHIMTRAERDYQEALYGYLVNWLRLKRESGTLEAGDLYQLNEWMIRPAS